MGGCSFETSSQVEKLQSEFLEQVEDFDVLQLGLCDYLGSFSSSNVRSLPSIHICMDNPCFAVARESTPAIRTKMTPTQKLARPRFYMKRCQRLTNG